MITDFYSIISESLKGKKVKIQIPLDDTQTSFTLAKNGKPKAWNKKVECETFEGEVKEVKKGAPGTFDVYFKGGKSVRIIGLGQAIEIVG